MARVVNGSLQLLQDLSRTFTYLAITITTTQQFAPSSLHRRLPLPLSHFDTIVATVVVTIGETGRVATIVQLMLVSVAIAVILRRFRTSGKISRSTDVVLVG